MKRLLPIGLLLLAACSSSPSAPESLGPTPTSPVTTTPGGGPSASALTPAIEPPVAGPSIAPGSSIIAVDVTTSLAPDGSADAPTTTFDHNRDRKLIVVLTLSNLRPGTKLSYVRYLDGKYVDSKSALTVGNARRFYFEFTAAAGQLLTAGLYRLRLYVAEHAVGEVSYRVR